MKPQTLLIITFFVIVFTSIPIALIRMNASRILDFIRRHFRISFEKDSKAVAMFVEVDDDLQILFITRSENPRTAIEVLRDRKIIVPDDTKIAFMELNVSRTSIESIDIGEMQNTMNLTVGKTITPTYEELQRLIEAYPDVFPS